MSAPQMICHLSDAFLVTMGEKYASPATGLFQRTFLKWAALHMPMNWPPGVPTRPELEQGVGGTPPGDWDGDRAQLLSLIDAFIAHRGFSPHPAFGPMSKRQWMIWGYRHIDHHLRQFGA
jgi:hypothetical protein